MPKHKIFIIVKPFGQEEALCSISERLHEKVWVNDDKLSILQKLGVGVFFTKNRKRSRIISVQSNFTNGHFEQREQKAKRPHVTFLLTGCYHNKDKDDAKLKSTPGLYVFPYSGHSCHSELVEFISKLKPRVIRPIVTNKEGSSNNSSIIPESIFNLCQKPSSEALSSWNGDEVNAKNDMCSKNYAFEGGKKRGQKFSVNKECTVVTEENCKTSCADDSMPTLFKSDENYTCTDVANDVTSVDKRTFMRRKRNVKSTLKKNKKKKTDNFSINEKAYHNKPNENYNAIENIPIYEIDASNFQSKLVVCKKENNIAVEKGTDEETDEIDSFRFYDYGDNRNLTDNSNFTHFVDELICNETENTNTDNCVTLYSGSDCIKEETVDDESSQNENGFVIGTASLKGEFSVEEEQFYFLYSDKDEDDDNVLSSKLRRSSSVEQINTDISHINIITPPDENVSIADHLLKSSPLSSVPTSPGTPNEVQAVTNYKTNLKLENHFLPANSSPFELGAGSNSVETSASFDFSSFMENNTVAEEFPLLSGVNELSSTTSDDSFITCNVDFPILNNAESPMWSGANDFLKKLPKNLYSVSSDILKKTSPSSNYFEIDNNSREGDTHCSKNRFNTNIKELDFEYLISETEHYSEIETNNDTSLSSNYVEEINEYDQNEGISIIILKQEDCVLDTTDCSSNTFSNNNRDELVINRFKTHDYYNRVIDYDCENNGVCKNEYGINSQQFHAMSIHINNGENSFHTCVNVQNANKTDEHSSNYENQVDDFLITSECQDKITEVRISQVINNDIIDSIINVPPSVIQNISELIHCKDNEKNHDTKTDDDHHDDDVLITSECRDKITEVQSLQPIHYDIIDSTINVPPSVIQNRSELIHCKDNEKNHDSKTDDDDHNDDDVLITYECEDKITEVRSPQTINNDIIDSTINVSYSVNQNISELIHCKNNAKNHDSKTDDDDVLITSECRDKITEVQSLQPIHYDIIDSTINVPHSVNQNISELIHCKDNEKNHDTKTYDDDHHNDEVKNKDQTISTLSEINKTKAVNEHIIPKIKVKLAVKKKRYSSYTKNKSILLPKWKRQPGFKMKSLKTVKFSASQLCKSLNLENVIKNSFKKKPINESMVDQRSSNNETSDKPNTYLMYQNLMMYQVSISSNPQKTTKFDMNFWGDLNGEIIFSHEIYKSSK